ncbi:hypothetical protein BC830DRAFT_241300, partial [Chytriomyces sp. MP71]
SNVTGTITSAVTTFATTTAEPSPTHTETLFDGYQFIHDELASLPICLTTCANKDHSTVNTNTTANHLCQTALGPNSFDLAECVFTTCQGDDLSTVLIALTDYTVSEQLNIACELIVASLPPVPTTTAETTTAEPTSISTPSIVTTADANSTASISVVAPILSGINGLCGGSGLNPSGCVDGLVCIYQAPSDTTLPGTCQLPIISDQGQACGGKVSAHPASCATSLACQPNFLPGLPGLCVKPKPSPTHKKHIKYKLVIRTVPCTTTTTTSAPYSTTTTA